MRIVIALGGNALLKRGEPMTADHQRAMDRQSAQAEHLGDLRQRHLIDEVQLADQGPLLLAQ